MRGLLKRYRYRRILKTWAAVESSDASVADNANVRAERTNVVDLLGDQPTHSEHRSLLFFGMHRGGSSFAASLLAWLAESYEIRPINLEAHRFHFSDALLECRFGRKVASSIFYVDAPDGRSVRRALRQVFQTTGHYYGPLRDPYLLQKLPHRDQFTTILLLRDPRDVLTSMYFSLAKSHVMPKNNPRELSKMKHGRDVLNANSIDDYVRWATTEFLSRYDVYLNVLANSSNVTILRYEDMISDFPAWVDAILDAWQLPISALDRATLLNAEDFAVAKENPSAHKRQVLAGDHRRKLQPDTIAFLNEKFAAVLAALDYPLDAGADAAA